MEYTYHVPTRVIFGCHKIEDTGQILAEYTKPGNVLLVCDPGEWIYPVLERLSVSLKKHGFTNIVTYNSISPNPKLSECAGGVKAAEENSSEIIVAVGGGSTLDAAKKIARDVSARFFITVPTTAGTGSETNEWSVLTVDETHEKVSMKNMPAHIAILDPVTNMTMPGPVTLFTGLDAFSHGMEAYMAKGASRLTDLQALAGCRLVVENLEKVLENGGDKNARANMLEASLLAGMAMQNAGLGILHCVANIVPGFYPMYAHGFLCGTLIKSTFEYNFPALTTEKRNVLKPLVNQCSLILNKWLEIFNIDSIAVKEKDIDKIKKISAVNVNGLTNPRKVTEEGIEEVMRKSFRIV